MCRYVSSGILPEFSQQAGRDAYVRNHPLPPYAKEEWSDDKRLPRSMRSSHNIPQMHRINFVKHHDVAPSSLG